MTYNLPPMDEVHLRHREAVESADDEFKAFKKRVLSDITDGKSGYLVDLYYWCVDQGYVDEYLDYLWRKK